MGNVGLNIDAILKSRPMRLLQTLTMEIFDRLAVLFVAKRHCNRQILIIRLDGIGDFVLWLEAAKALVGHYHNQGRKVVLLGHLAWSDWANEMGLADEVWGMEPLRFLLDLRYRLHWLRRIKRENFEVVIQPTYSRKFYEGDSLVRASGASQRIGSQGDPGVFLPGQKWQKDMFDGWYTKLVPATNKPLMELSRNSEFLSGLGLPDFPACVPSLGPLKKIFLPETINTPYAVLFPSGRWAGKRWPSERFVEIGRRLIARGVRIVVAGGEADRNQCAYVVEALGGMVTDMVGKTTLSCLTELLLQSEVLVSNDTGVVHIGAAVGVPVVCILGGGHFGRFLPYTVQVEQNDRPMPIIVYHEMACFNCNWRCRFPRLKNEPVKCINEITVEQVWRAVEQAIN